MVSDRNIILIIFSSSLLPGLTLSPVTGRRLDYTIFSVDLGVTAVTKNSCLFAVL